MTYDLDKYTRFANTYHFPLQETWEEELGREQFEKWHQVLGCQSVEAITQLPTII